MQRVLIDMPQLMESLYVKVKYPSIAAFRITARKMLSVRCTARPPCHKRSSIDGFPLSISHLRAAGLNGPSESRKRKAPSLRSGPDKGCGFRHASFFAVENEVKHAINQTRLFQGNQL